MVPHALACGYFISASERHPEMHFRAQHNYCALKHAEPDLAMKHIHPIQLRFADTDALGHVNNAAYSLYIESARVGFLVDTGLPVSNLVLARIEIDYKMQVKFDAQASFTDPAKGMVVESQVERIGRTSMTLRQQIQWKGQLAADVRTVVVNFDYGSNAPAPVSEEIKQILAAYAVAGG